MKRLARRILSKDLGSGEAVGRQLAATCRSRTAVRVVCLGLRIRSDRERLRARSVAIGADRPPPAPSPVIRSSASEDAPRVEPCPGTRLARPPCPKPAQPATRWAPVRPGAIYVAPDGSDTTGNGPISHPYSTLEKARTEASAYLFYCLSRPIRLETPRALLNAARGV